MRGPSYGRAPPPCTEPKPPSAPVPRNARPRPTVGRLLHAPNQAAFGAGSVLGASRLAGPAGSGQVAHTVLDQPAGPLGGQAHQRQALVGGHPGGKAGDG